jgi:hypothetical protein
MWSRRKFIRALGILGGAMLSPLYRFEGSRSYAQSPSTGELYAGFLLLPEGAPVPASVKYPELGIPIVCGVGAGRGGPEPTAASKRLETAEGLAKEVQFPIYTLGDLPDGLRPAGASLIKHKSGDIFAASVNFELHNAKTDSWETTVSIWVYPDFPRPFPLWSSNPVELGGPAITLEKVDFLPSSGIVTAARRGYVFHWIRNNVFYTLMAENDLSRQEAFALATSLTLVRS